MITVSKIADLFSKKVCSSTISSLNTLSTPNVKSPNTCAWMFGCWDGVRQGAPESLGGILIDWDDKVEARIVNGSNLLYFHHQTHSLNHRYIIPFAKPIETPTPFQYKNLVIKVCKVLSIDHLCSAFDDNSFNFKQFYELRPEKHPLLKSGSKLLKLDPKLLKQLKRSKDVKTYSFAPPIKYLDVYTPDKIADTVVRRVHNFLSFYESKIRWTVIKSDICHLTVVPDWHEPKTGDINFNAANKSGNKICSNIFCHHKSCKARCLDYIEPFRLIDKKTSHIIPLSYTAIYLSICLIEGLLSIDEIEACALCDMMKANLASINRFHWSPPKDADKWVKLAHESIVYDSNSDIIYDYKSGHYSPTAEKSLKIKWLDTIATYMAYRTGKCPYSYRDKLFDSALGAMEYRYHKLKHASNALACKNGLIILKKDGSHVFQAHSSKYFITYCSDFDYDPLAKCDLWLKILKDYFETADAPQIEMLQEYFGYCLTYDRSFEKFLIMFGKSRGGKNTIAETLGKLVQSCQLSLSSLCSENPGERDCIDGVKLVFCNELLSLNIRQVQELKKITSTDEVSIRAMRKGRYSTSRVPKILIAFNDLPEKLTIDDALRNRMLSIKFTKSFLGREDKKLKGKLEKELPGILNWALAGYKKIYTHQRFTPYTVDSDYLYDEANDEVQELKYFLSTLENKFYTCSELLTAYQEHQEDFEMTKFKFGRLLKKLDASVLYASRKDKKRGFIINNP